MKTNFFENFAALNVAGIWKLAIESDGNGNFTVSELFTLASCGDKAANQIIPLNLKGTAQELDEGFFESITEPILKTAGLLGNMEAYLKSLETARLASKIEQDKKAKALKPKTEAKSDETGEDIEITEPKMDKEAKKKAYDEAMKQVADLNDLCKYAEALEILPKVEDYPEKQAELEKKTADLNRKKEQHDKMLQLF